MTKQLAILFLLLCQTALAQNPLVNISGRVTDKQDFRKRISALKVRLNFSDSLFIETDCDSLGFYTFEVSKKLFNHNQAKVFVYQNFELINSLTHPLADCPFMFTGPTKYMGTRSISLDLNDSIEKYQVNFQLNPIIEDPRMPSINFAKNTTEFIKCPREPSGDTSLFCLKNLLLKYPTVVLEIEGHSCDECCVKDLSQKRANSIRQKLIDLGIDSLRIKTISKNDESPIFNSKIIRSAKTSEEKEILKSQNRRVVIKILSWDYGVKPRHATTNKSILEDDGEE